MVLVLITNFTVLLLVLSLEACGLGLVMFGLALEFIGLGLDYLVVLLTLLELRRGAHFPFIFFIIYNDIVHCH